MRSMVSLSIILFRISKNQGGVPKEAKFKYEVGGGLFWGALSAALRGKARSCFNCGAARARGFPRGGGRHRNRHVVWLKKTRSGYRFSHSSIHSLDEASLGMRQSPRGLRQQLPTLGPSGRQLRLNCCAKKRLKNVLSQCFMTSSEYSPVWPSVWLNAFFARKKIFEGRKPFRRT